MLFKSTRKLDKLMDTATSYADWSAAAMAHDETSGALRWQNMDPSRRYDYASIRIRLDRLRELRARHDNIGLLFTLNEGIHGNMGGMGKPGLYTRAKFGTKKLVNMYVEEINKALAYLASDAVTDISFEDKLDFFHRASHCYGRTALMMSGSGSLLYFHVGVIKALWEENLLPDVISGSSGGAIISGIVGTHRPEEVARMFEPDFLLQEVQQETGIWQNLSTLRPRRMAPEKIREVLARLIPDLTFQEAEELTGRHINVSVAPAETHQTSRLLNAIASPNVYIHDALMASAAVPGVYPPVMLMARNVHGERQPYLPSRKWVDGSVSNDLPAKRLGRLYGVNHFVVSQTNPIALPFVNDDQEDLGVIGLYKHAVQRTTREWINANMDIMRKPLTHMPVAEQWAKIARSIMNQQYTGDVNIMPSSRLINPMKLLTLRSEKEVMDMIMAGQRATWPKIEMIRIQSMISRTLDGILADYEGDYLQQITSSPLRRSQQLARRRSRPKTAADKAARAASNH